MENFVTDSIHVSIEWAYGDVIVLFHILHLHYQEKYFLPDRSINQVMAQQLRVIFFIYNCCVCLNGNKMTRFFNTSSPKFSDYLNHRLYIIII
jgi:hypothetical protein